MPKRPPARPNRRHHDIKNLDARELAATVVQRVVDDDAYVQRALAAALDRTPLDGRERSFATELVYGTLTYLRPIDAALDARLRKGLRSLSPTLQSILRVGTYQLLYRRDAVPSFAAVNAAVTTVRAQSGPALAGVANGVLRAIDRNATELVAPPDGSPELTFGHTYGLSDQLAAALIDRVGLDRATDVIRAWNAPTPVTIRVRTDNAEAVIDRLALDGIEARPHPHVPGAYVVASGDVAATPSFRDGHVAIQDPGAQLVGHLVPRATRGAILDACAGLGGKTRHLRDRCPDAHIIATDRDAKKLNELQVSRDERDQSNGRLSTATWNIGVDDVPPAVANAAPFDVVLVDAPCSGFGTLGRHPEIRRARDLEASAELARVQRTLLHSLAPLVAPGGYLVYAVCTWTRAEGPAQIDAFLHDHTEFELAPPHRNEVPQSDDLSAMKAPAWDILADASGHIETWPDRGFHDGFFMCRLRRRGARTKT